MHWNDLSHLEGSATDVPELVALMGSDDPGSVEEGFDRLYAAFVGWHPPETTDAAAALAAALLNRLPEAIEKGPTLLLLAEVLGADHVRYWSEDGPVPDPTVLAVVRKHEALVVGLLDDPRPSVRSAATVLASTARLRGAVPRLLELAPSDPDERVVASALIALAPFEDARVDGALDEALARSGGAPLVLGAVTLGRLRRDASASTDAHRAGIEAWLGWEPPPWSEDETELAWFGAAWASTYRIERPHDGFCRALAGAAARRARTEQLVSTLLEIGAKRAPGAATRRAGALVADLGGLEHRFKAGPVQDVVPFEMLSEREQRTARALGDGYLLPGPSRGLPAAKLPRARWAGLPHPDLPSGELGSSFVRWHAAVDRVSGARGGAPLRIVDADQMESLLAAAAAAPSDAMRAVTDDLALRFGAMQAEGARPPRSAPLTALALLPFVRRNEPIPPAWDVIVDVTPEPSTQEVFASLEPARREAILFRHLSSRRPTDPAGLKEAIALLDLGASRRNVEALKASLATAPVASFFGAACASMRDRVREAEARLSSLS